MLSILASGLLIFGFSVFAIIVFTIIINFLLYDVKSLDKHSLSDRIVVSLILAISIVSWLSPILVQHVVSH